MNRKAESMALPGLGCSDLVSPFSLVGDSFSVVFAFLLQDHAYKKSSPYAILKSFTDDLKLLPIPSRTEQAYREAFVE